MLFAFAHFTAAATTDEFNYCIAPTTSTYSLAKEWCANRSMTLIQPKTSALNLQAGGACSLETKSGCWLGLTESKQTEGLWTWNDGSALQSYVNWASVDMRNYNGNEQHAALLLLSRDASAFLQPAPLQQNFQLHRPLPLLQL